MQLHVVVFLEMSRMRHCSKQLSMLIQVRCSRRHHAMWLCLVWLGLSQFASFLNKVCSHFLTMAEHAVHRTGTVRLAAHITSSASKAAAGE